MDTVRELLPVILSVTSLAVSAYLWRVRMRRERPGFRTTATSPVDRAVSLNGSPTDRTAAVGYGTGEFAR